MSNNTNAVLIKSPGIKASRGSSELVLDKTHQDENKVFRQLVSEIDENIQVQSYWVTTDDHYRLKVFRLIKSNKYPGPPVLLQHGLFENAEKFVWEGHRSIAI